MRHRAAYLIALLVLAAPITMASDSNKPETLAAAPIIATKTSPPAPDWSLETLMSEMAKVKSARAQFTEVKHLAITTVPVKASGKLLYKAPDYIERRTEQPQHSYFIVEKNNLRVKSAGQKERQVILYQFPPLHALVEAMRATLSGNMKTLKQYYQVSFSGNRKNWTLELTPLDEEMMDFVDKMKLHGQHTRLFKVETLEAGGDRTIMSISQHSD